MRTLRREELRSAIAARLRGSRAVLAVWEAGSAARGRVDALSDLDIGVLIRAGSQARVWRRIDALFAELGGIALRWHEPDPLFKNIDKKTYRLVRARRWLQIDLGLFVDGAGPLHNEHERHGDPVVLYDPANRLSRPTWDPAAHQRAMRIALHHLVMRWALYREFFRKELARGRDVDAFRAYFGFVVQPVATVLGMVHRPARWDFGLRYLHEELPPAATAVISRLCYLPDARALEARSREAARTFRKALRTLARRGITPLDEGGEDINTEFR